MDPRQVVLAFYLFANSGHCRSSYCSDENDFGGGTQQHLESEHAKEWEQMERVSIIKENKHSGVGSKVSCSSFSAKDGIAGVMYSQKTISAGKQNNFKKNGTVFLC